MKEIKNKLKELEEFDEMQVSGVMTIVKTFFTNKEIEEFLEYLKDDKTSKTRNDIYEYVMKKANMDLNPYEIID